MAAIDYLKQHELEVELKEESRLRVWPKENITPAVRDWIKQHKAELLTELGAANHPRFTLDARRRAWTVRLGSKQMTVLSPVARTKAETLASVSARWPGADVEVIEP